jgi:hypothetical protein
MKKNKNKINNIDKNVNVIEIIAEYIYLVIVGEKNKLDIFIKKINNNMNNNKINFIISRLDIPILFEYDKIQYKFNKQFNKQLKLDYSIESAQSYAYAQESYILSKNKKNNNNLIENNNDKYMLMMICDDILGFPKIDLVEEDPEKMIIDWIKKYSGIIPESIKKSIKPLSLVGLEDEILVYSVSL